MGKWNTPDDKHIDYLETRYMYEERRKVYLANEETNQAWDESDIPDVVKAWNNNWTLGEIAEYLGADQWEMLLLMADLLKQGKVKGNIHVFKPKNRKVEPFMELNISGENIRSVQQDKQMWVCLKDVWRWLGKPDHTYRKVTEGWGPQYRAKFKMGTNSGVQFFIFINTQGLDKLFRNVEKEQWDLICELKEVMENGLGIQSGRKTKTQTTGKKTKRTGRISRQDPKKDR